MNVIFQLFDILCQGVDQRHIQVFPPLLARKKVCQVMEQPFPSLRMQSCQGFSGGENAHGGQIIAAALGINVKIAHGVQLVAEEFQTDGIVLSGRVDIHNAAADGELAHALHNAAAAVACSNQTRAQLVQRIFLADFQSEAGLVQNMGRQGPQTHGLPGHDLNGGRTGGQIIELPQTLLLPAAGDNRCVIKGQVPAWQDGGGQPQKALQLLLGPAGSHIVLAEHHNGPGGILVQSGNHMAPIDLSDAGDGGIPVIFNSLNEGGVLRDGLQQKKQGLFHNAPHLG